MNSININTVEEVLHKLHEEAKDDFLKLNKEMMKFSSRSMQPVDFEHMYLPISKQQGQLLRELIVKNHCKHVVEFGTSFGISTIYLADAVRQTGGKVITTELLETKAKKAIQNISDANLSKYVEVRIGNATQSLKEYCSPIDFLFLDGWKDLYLTLFQMLESQFHSGTIIYADNMDMEGTKPYANYVLSNKNAYSTQSVDNGKGFLTFVSTN